MILFFLWGDDRSIQFFHELKKNYVCIYSLFFLLFSALCEGVQPKVNEDVCQRHGKNNNLTVEEFL